VLKFDANKTNPSDQLEICRGRIVSSQTIATMSGGGGGGGGGGGAPALTAPAAPAIVKNLL